MLITMVRCLSIYNNQDHQDKTHLRALSQRLLIGASMTLFKKVLEIHFPKMDGPHKTTATGQLTSKIIKPATKIQLLSGKTQWLMELLIST